MEFSAMANDAFSSALKAFNRSQVIVVGVETHICISQTCHGLQAQGYEAVVCPDAVSASTQDRHKLGMERLRDAGIIPAHTEAIAYEWMRTADDTRFKAMLKLVKESEF
jgi:nicotinamidase-related amidase